MWKGTAQTAKAPRKVEIAYCNAFQNPYSYMYHDSVLHTTVSTRKPLHGSFNWGGKDKVRCIVNWGEAQFAEDLMCKAFKHP